MPDSDIVSVKRPGTWPRRVRLALEAIVTVMTNAYMMARSRAAGSPSKIVRLMAERDDALWRAAIAERKCEILRRRRGRTVFTAPQEVRNRAMTRSEGLFGPPGGAETVGGEKNLHGTGLGIPF